MSDSRCFFLEVWKMRQHPSGANSAGNMPELQREILRQGKAYDKATP